MNPHLQDVEGGYLGLQMQLTCKPARKKINYQLGNMKIFLPTLTNLMCILSKQEISKNSPIIFKL